MKKKTMTWLTTYALMLTILTVVVCNPLTAPTTSAQTRTRPDPRGLDRYTLTGQTAPLTIFSYPPYDSRNPDFFEGWGRMTAEELGLTGAEFWNEFGRRAELGKLHAKAIIRFKNGFQWDEAYLEGCLKNGKVYFNRIKLVKKPTIIPPTIQKELCVNIPLAVEDVPKDWTIKDEANGRKSCHYPIPDPVQLDPIDNTCRPGQNTRILEEHNKKGFDPIALINSKLPADQALKVAGLMAVPESVKKITDLIVYFDGCNYVVFAYSIINKGLGWWKWVIPALIVAAFLLGYYANGGSGTTKITPTKTTPPNGSQGPVRPPFII